MERKGMFEARTGRAGVTQRIRRTIRRYRRSRSAHAMRRQRLPWQLWRDSTMRLPTLSRLTPRERLRLRQLAGELLQQKLFSGAGGLQIDDAMRVSIAAQACLLIVNMKKGLRPFEGWTEVIVYPDTFRVRRETLDDSGVMHVSHDDLAGESWDRGPVILSWGDIQPDGPDTALHGTVILHEFAHKLDALRGAATGMPPLPRNMDQREWTRAFTTAYEQLCIEADAGHETPIDPYAAEAPAEFFAVATEYFFEAPDTLRIAYPQVYAQLTRYFRQAPAAESASTGL